MSTLSLPQLISTLTTAGVADEATIQTFIQEFSALIEGTLARGENVTIKGIGTFGVTWIAGEPAVDFAPDATLATTVNAPFAIFEPVELPSNLSDADIESDLTTESIVESTAENATATCEIVPPPIPQPISAVTNTTAEPTPGTVLTAEMSPESELEPEPEVETEPTPEPEFTSESAPEPEHKPQPAHINEPETVQRSNNVEKIIEHEHVIEVRNPAPHHSLHILLASLLSLIVGVIIGYFITSRLSFNNVKNVNIEAEGVNVISRAEAKSTIAQPDKPNAYDMAKADSIAPVTDSTSTEPRHEVAAITSKIVTDTVRGNRYLTTMARDHYGKKIFWVYIYEENKNILSDPDNIASNTIVIIPPADKYGIKSGDKQSEADAQRRAAAILNSQK